MEHEVTFWYEAPMVCRFVWTDRLYHRGIVFHEWVVDLENGRAILTTEILKAAHNMGIDADDAIIESVGWVDFTAVYKLS